MHRAVRPAKRALRAGFRCARNPEALKRRVAKARSDASPFVFGTVPVCVKYLPLSLQRRPDTAPYAPRWKLDF
jgi:hypothetical protein